MPGGNRFDDRAMEKDTSRESYDAIVIGSGLGGLTSAALLAKSGGRKVLVMEQHSKAGGFTHSFKRMEKFRFDAGLHYVGSMDGSDAASHILDYISKNPVQWNHLPHIFERYLLPGLDLPVASDLNQWMATLMERFPAESGALRSYFKSLKRIARHFIFLQIATNLPPIVRLLISPYLAFIRYSRDTTTGTYLSRQFQDPLLKAALCARSGDYGLPPSCSPIGLHCLIEDHYATGAWYPVGGSSRLAEEIIPTIEQSGGRVEVLKRAVEIMVEGGRVTGVQAIHSRDQEAPVQTYHSPIVISDTGAWSTYEHLLPEPYRSHAEKSIPAPLKAGYSVIIVFIGFKESPAKLGIQGENLWIHQSTDPDARFCETLSDPREKPSACFVSFSSMNNPDSSSHTAQIIMPADYSLFEKWKEKPVKKRGDDYLAFKESIGRAMIALVEEKIPGFENLIEFHEVATPLTIEHYTRAHRGSIYGLTPTPDKFSNPLITIKTPVKNLYLTGSDAMFSGINGVIMGGAFTAGKAMGSMGFPRIMRNIYKERAKQ